MVTKQDPTFSSDKHFSMLFPPPNVTGDIHLGHALTSTIQDVMIRWKQKQNFQTRWIPGMDHAGIATQVVVEKTLFKQKKIKRHDLGREAFLKEVWNWKNQKGSSIVIDLKKMGMSFDWDKEYFTMDQNLSNAVDEAFIRLFEKGLIYREESLINWSCSLESAISDVEVENLEIHGKTEVPVPNYDINITFGIITQIAYKVVGSNEEVQVATTRPETILGDVAVAVHPNDNRYNHLRNSQLWHPYRKESIPLIFDESVDPEFGTGAVKITPAHDKIDFEIAKRHKLPNVNVITTKGLIANGFEQFSGLPRFIAREKVLHSLAELELYRGSDWHSMILPICSRSKDVIEFLLRPQWFVKCDEMSKKAVKAVETGELKIHPQNFEKEWFRWLKDCRDWCISRQLWWGHQIPVYKITAEGKSETWIAAKSKEEAEAKFKEKNQAVSEFSIERDQDVLDTWFSSGLLPFSVFNWPNTNEDFKKFFPLSVMETGHDILFFWVARMVMLSIELTGKLPFKEVLLHGIICDAYGRKMSKSLGNVILPAQIINGSSLAQLREHTEDLVKKGILNERELEKSLDGQMKMFPSGIKECGIDALRFTLCSYNLKNHFISFDVHDCFTNSKFFNKIYNATKFANTMAENSQVVIREIKTLDGVKLSDMDRWLLSRLGKTVRQVRSAMDSYNFHFATAALKTFFYDNFCNVYIETARINRMMRNELAKPNSIVANACLSVALNHMEVFTPFLASKLKPFVAMNCDFDPESFIDDEFEKEIEKILEICDNIRGIKSEFRLTNKISSTMTILIRSLEHERFIRSHEQNMKALTHTNDLSFTTSEEEFDNEDFMGSSTAGPLCSVGLKILGKSEGRFDKDLNQKKLWKMEMELTALHKIVGVTSYQQNANEKVKKKHHEKVN